MDRLTAPELARYLYEMMEEIEDHPDYPEGGPWDLLREQDKAWYFKCAERLLRDYALSKHPRYSEE